jgi:adenylate cyclase
LIPGVFGWAPATSSAAAARAAADRVVAIDDTDGRAHGVLGTIALYFDWTFDVAREELERGVALAPHEFLTRHAMADYYMIMGDVDRSLKEVRIGRDANPEWPVAHGAVTFHATVTRRYDEAIDETRRVLQQFPELTMARNNLADALWHAGRYEEALPLIHAAFGKDVEGWQAFEDAFRKGGPRAAYKTRGDQLVKLRATRPVSPYAIANAFALADEPDATLEWLERAFEVRLPILLHVTADPAFDTIRNDPRFKDLLARIGIPSAPRSS